MELLALNQRKSARFQVVADLFAGDGGFGVDLLVTDAAKAHASPSFVLREMPATPVKGIAEPVRTWFVEAGS